MATASPAKKAGAASVEETLGWEAEHRPRAGIAAIAAGLLILAGAIIEGFATRGRPNSPLIGVLQGALTGAPNRPSQQVPLFQFLDDRIVPLSLAAVLPAIGFLLLIPVLGYLYRATAAREPKIPRPALILGLIGPALLGVGALAFQLGLSRGVHNFLTGSNRSIPAANDVGSSALISAGQLMQLAGTLATAFALLFIALNAMRVGLLTRFMGILGMISGVALVFLPRNPVINFWLIALGVLILGHWPGGTPSAWGSGRAEPWPSQQELRERRQEAPADLSEPRVGDGPDARPALQKRKRKRR